jgi:predicted transcriptional regulator
MLKNCNCSNYCFICVSQHSAFTDLVWSVTEKALEYIADETQKKTTAELWQDTGNTCYQMENAINEAVSTVLFNSMTAAEIRELIK